MNINCSFKSSWLRCALRWSLHWGDRSKGPTLEYSQLTGKREDQEYPSHEQSEIQSDLCRGLKQVLDSHWTNHAICIESKPNSFYVLLFSPEHLEVLICSLSITLFAEKGTSFNRLGRSFIKQMLQKVH